MIVAIANQKGGVAKTTSTICLGGLLQESSSCLAVDLDAQGNLTIGLGVEIADGQLSTYNVITEQAEVLDAVVSTKSGLHLLPADISLAKGETEILTKVGNFLILKERLEPALTQFQHILIDCPPSLGLLTVNALSAADVVLIPVQCQFFALKGLAALLETIQSIQRRLNPNLKILGILPTMAEMNTIMTQDVLASLKKRFKDVPVFDPVPKSVKFAESNLAGEPIHLYAGDAKLSAAYKGIAQALLQSQSLKR
jgi:chromosome partitioning protein